MRQAERSRTPAVSVATYRSDPLFPRIEKVPAKLLETGKVVTPIDVLVGIELLARADLEDWRRGRVSSLERVIACKVAAVISDVDALL